MIIFKSNGEAAGVVTGRDFDFIGNVSDVMVGVIRAVIEKDRL